jgi:predicted SAM-dependent methyltransferase
MIIRVPWRIRKASKSLFSAVKENLKPPTGLHCPVCGTGNVTFLPLPSYYNEMRERYGSIHSDGLSETMNRRQYSCSKCHASDRDRLYALYFRQFVRDGGSLTNILDIAPQPALTQFLKTLGATNYRSADMTATGVDDRVDIQNMSIYADGQFQIFICSHVLEHVTNDLAAMRELYRVLAPGGWGICMVPINLGLSDVYENPDIVDEADRWKHFGQNDHVRVYSKAGFIARLQSVGFTVQQYDISKFGKDVFSRHGIHPNSVLYVARKHCGQYSGRVAS